MQIFTNNSMTQSSNIKTITQQTFHQDVIEASRNQAVLVDFWAPWCEPCRQLTPLLEKFVLKTQNRFILAKINIDEEPEIAQQMRIQSLPTVIAFIGGSPVDGFTGILSPEELQAFFDRLKGSLPVTLDDVLEEGKTRLAQNDITGAVQHFTQVLTHDASNVKAMVGMAQAHLRENQIEKAKGYFTLIPAEAHDQMDTKALKKAIDFVDEGQKIGELKPLQDAIEQNPLDFEKRILFAKGLFARGQAAEAIDQLFFILSQKETTENSSAKSELFNFLDVLGGFTSTFTCHA